MTAKGIFYKGKPFVYNTMYKMMKSKRYAGIYHYKGKPYDNIFPAIISMDTYSKIQDLMQANKLGRKNTQVNYVLREKLLCGYCRKPMQGDYGKSHTGNIFYYYVCMGMKKLRNCNKKRIRKDLLEKIVINTTLRLLNNDDTLTFIATEIVKLHNEKAESESIIKILAEQKSDAVKSLNNIMKAIEAGIINDTTKNRMAELETTIKEINDKISYEQVKIENCITVNDIKSFVLTALKKTSYAMIRNLIKQIVVYNDKIEIFYYYTSKNPDDNGRDFTLIRGSDSSPMVEIKGLEPSAYALRTHRSTN